MARVLFVQNGEFDQPGLFAKVLGECGVAVDVIHAWRGEAVPSRPRGWAGVAIGGGSMSAYEAAQFPFLRAEEVLISGAREAKVPVLGMCLGAQLMAGAFGGAVFLNTRKEIGFHEVRFSAEALRDVLWNAHAGAPFRPVHWHRDTFSLPRGAVRLASSDLTENQLFCVDGTHYGLQFHLEIDEAVLTGMLESDDGGGLEENGIDRQEFLREAAIAFPKVERIAREVFTQWTDMLA